MCLTGSGHYAGWGYKLAMGKAKAGKGTYSMNMKYCSTVWNFY